MRWNATVVHDFMNLTSLRFPAAHGGVVNGNDGCSFSRVIISPTFWPEQDFG